MTYLRRKLFRDLRGMKFQGALIVLSIAIAVAMYGGLLLVKDNAFASRDKLLDETNYEDGRLSFFNYAEGDKVEGMITPFDAIDAYELRLSVNVVVKVQGDTFPGVAHGILGDEHPEVNDFVTKQGDFFHPDVNRTDAIVVDERFATENGIQLGDEISVSFGDLSENMTVEEIAFGPEHMYSMNPLTGMPEKGIFAPLWFSLDAFMEGRGLPTVVNELLLKVNGDRNEVLHDISNALENGGITSQIIYAEDELDYNMMTEDIGTMDEISAALGVIILLVSAFVIYDSILKLITNQTTLIGVLMAIGATTTDLLIHYVSYAMILATLGVVLGIPLGFVIMFFSVKVFVGAIGLPPITSVFHVGSFAPAILLAITIAFLAGVISTRKVTSISPVDAITNQSIKQDFTKKSRIESLLNRVFRKSRYTYKIPLRNVLRRRRRTILTIVTLGMAAIIIIATFGYLDSFFHQVDVFYRENYRYNMEVTLDRPVPLETINRELGDIQGIQYEGFIRQPVYLEGIKGNFSSVLYAYPENSLMRKYSFQEGGLKPGEIALGQVIARKLGAEVGDEITILTSGKDQFTAIERTYRVGGIVQEFLDQFAFMELEFLQDDFNYGSSLNAVAISYEGDADEIQDAIADTDLPITSITDIEQSKESFIKLMEAIIAFSYFIILLGVIVLLIFSLNIVVLDAKERDREFVNLRVNGGGLAVIARIIGLQILLIAVFVMVLDYFISPYFTQFLIDASLKNLMYVSYYINPLSYVLSLVAFVAGIGIGTLSAIRESLSLDIVEVMRLRFRN